MSIWQYSLNTCDSELAGAVPARRMAVVPELRERQDCAFAEATRTANGAATLRYQLAVERR
jgi:hypothetical protein